MIQTVLNGIKIFNMAHFIKLHTLEGAEMLFNLDVVVSIDPLSDGTMVQTRWGGTKVKEDIEVTAIELDPELARLYQERFPDDKVIITDAHQYLLDHYKEYDFILYFNSRNIRRKQTSDAILAFRSFLDTLPKDKAKKCAFVLKTEK